MTKGLVVETISDDDADVLRGVFAAERIARAAGETMFRPYAAIATWIIAQREALGRPLTVGVCGAQGSGKSTLAQGVAALIAHRSIFKPAVLSIDDFYLSRAARRHLAATVHPLFATRGPPGTHDLALAAATIDRLVGADDGMITSLPRFDKAEDDIAPRCDWPPFEGRADIVLFEGWCVGAAPEADAGLAFPINTLERDEDADGVWRRGVNAALTGSYQDVFARIDRLLLIAAPSFDCVFAWRREQERKLAMRTGGAAIMDDAAIRRFIDHYERLTRHILREMPSRADGVMVLEDDRTVRSLSLGRASATGPVHRRGQ